MTEKRRDLSFSPRKEDIREANPVVPPVQFTLEEIKRHFSESLDSLKKQSAVADSLYAEGNYDGCKIIWRSQVVLSEGLLDFFIHEISKYCLFRMFTGQWEKSAKYASITVPMDKVEAAIAASESKDWFFSYLNERFSRDVFLSSESMKDQLNLIGIGFETVMSKAFPRKNKSDSNKEGAGIVKALFQRRNDIAHQNDLSHASAQQNDISREFVSDYISKIEAIVDAIYDTAKEKDRKSR